MTTRRSGCPRRSGVAPAILLLAAVLAGCGTGPAGPVAGAPANGAFPVTVPGKFGPTTVPARPVRVVAMSWTDADLALALGVTPVGMARANQAPGGVQPWTAAALGGATPATFESLGSDPIEQVAALAPDLILATRDYHLDRAYRQLSRLAPVVTYVEGPNVDSWQGSVRAVAAALGVPERGPALVADTEASIARQRAAHPELAGRTYSYVITPSPSGVHTVNTEDDVSARLLAAVGMRLSPTVLGLPTADLPGRAQLSPENVGLLDADVVVAAASDQELATLLANPVFAQLPAVRRGAFVSLGYLVAVGLAFPSPLSIEWSLRQAVPKLAAAVR